MRNFLHSSALGKSLPSSEEQNVSLPPLRQKELQTRLWLLFPFGFQDTWNKISMAPKDLGCSLNDLNVVIPLPVVVLTSRQYIYIF